MQNFSSFTLTLTLTPQSYPTYLLHADNISNAANFGHPLHDQ